MTRCVVLSIVASLVVLAGCGDGGDGQSASTTAASTSSTADAATVPSPPADVTTPTAPSGLAGEDLTADQTAQLQQEVDAGHQPWRLDQIAVAEAFVADRLGWTEVESRLTDPQTVEVTNQADGAMVTLQLQQPARAGADGVWVVVAGAQRG